MIGMNLCADPYIRSSLEMGGARQECCGVVRQWYRLRMTREQQLEAPCTECSTLVQIKDRKQRSQYRRSGRVYCTPECRDAWVKRDRSQRMSATNRKYASE